jgi:parallel beta-helix repeat protein
MFTHVMITAIATLGQTADVPLITIDRDNVEITQSCRARIAHTPIIDADNNGVIHITASDIAVEFADDSPALHGANDDQTPDAFAGKGIVITGQNVTLASARVSGYKVGIHAIKAEGLTVHHCDVSNNFHQHLKSTPEAEDASDWLWPHANDNNEWITNYGAGLCVEDANNVTLHDIRARKTQNGIILDAVNDSKVYDCDCSFLSGWGLAMWRSNRNVISRNAFDFCVRGYSHGVYNRGQDSAGILMFEQCCDNVIAENSATHCGDGLFGFAGKEALGEVNPREDLKWYGARGNNNNLLWSNDFSYAVAHGIEMTFSAGNTIIENRLVGNAICGIWGGYSHVTLIADNHIASNGEMAYGLERGGINIEHGRGNTIYHNRFERNRCGIHLWTDDDAGIMQLPWGRANGPYGVEQIIQSNSFDGNQVDLQMREVLQTVAIANTGLDREHIEADDASRVSLKIIPRATASMPRTHEAVLRARGAAIGKRQAAGSRAKLAGRENIIMTEGGPWDHESPLLQFVRHFDTADEYRLRGASRMPAGNEVTIEGDAIAMVRGELIGVLAKQQDTLTPYRISFDIDGQRLSASGLLTGGSWNVMSFPSSVDPRENADKWREDGVAKAHRLTVDALDLRFGSGGMSDAMQLPVRTPSDHFGTIATRTLTVPPGRWRITTTSDDGIRVWMDEELVIDDWTHHAPKEHTHEFEVGEGAGGRTIDFRVEHFELDGHAALQLEIAPQIAPGLPGVD